MSFVRGRRYQHIHNTDVCFEVKHSFFILEKREWSVVIRWFNCVNPDNIVFIAQETVRIPEKKADEWEIYDAKVRTA